MYGIGLASRLTGVPVETIRIWERRYNLPQPRRSAGGHRKFSDDDIELLRALKALTDNGARIGHLAGESRDSLLAAARALAAPVELADGELPEEVDFAELITAVVEAAKRQDTDRAAELLNRPLVHRHAREVMLGFYLPVLREVGDLWHAGEISIASEHLIEKQVTGRIHSILVNRARKEGPEAVLACLPGERHEAALLAAAVLLDLGGFSVTYLGADLPVPELLRVTRTRHPRLVLLSSTVAPESKTLAALTTAAGDESLRDAILLVGGAGGRSLAAASDGRFEAVDSLEALEEITTQLAAAS